MTLRLACLISAASGFVALSYEILWYRVISFVTRGAAVAFGALLAFYLLGIAIGSFVSRRWCEDRADGGSPDATNRALGRYLVLANVVAFLVAPATGRMATVLPWPVGLVLVLVATALLGAVLPLTSHAAIAPDDHAGARLSYLYLANILGSCAGSLGTGFVAMQYLTTVQMAVGLALAGLALSIAVVLATENVPRVRAWTAGAVAISAALVVLGAPSMFDRIYERLLYKGTFRGHERFVQTVENRSGIINVSEDGRVWGGGVYDGVFNTDIVDDTNLIVRAYAIEAMRPRMRRLLMVGLASGSWAKVLASAPGLERFTIVEINPGYLEIIVRHPEVAGILHDPKIDIVIDDGRRWLESHPDARFDGVVMNTTWHWRANATNLLSREFFELVKRHLSPGGAFFFNTTYSHDVCRTATESFPHTLRVINFVAGSDSPIDVDPVRWKDMLESYRIDGRPVLDLDTDRGRNAEARLVATMKPGDGKAELELDANLRKTCADGEIVTDDNMLPEWRELVH